MINYDIELINNKLADFGLSSGSGVESSKFDRESSTLSWATTLQSEITVMVRRVRLLSENRLVRYQLSEPEK